MDEYEMSEESFFGKLLIYARVRVLWGQIGIGVRAFECRKQLFALWREAIHQPGKAR
jgi:hypothetical protein